MANWTPIAETLFTSARNRSWREAAACWLLAECGAFESVWPDRLHQAGLIEWEHQPDEDWDLASVRWDDLTRRLSSNTDFDMNLPGTGAELCMLRFACSLMTGSGGDWANGLTSLDHTNQRLIFGAITWAAGGEQAAHRSGFLEEG